VVFESQQSFVIERGSAKVQFTVTVTLGVLDDFRHQQRHASKAVVNLIGGSVFVNHLLMISLL
jgi:hypothetical protein